MVSSSWFDMRLSELADINMGQSPLSKDCNELGVGLPFYQGNADFGYMYPSPTKYCTKPKKAALEGDILISVRAPVGDVNIATEKCAIGRGISAISPSKAKRMFLFYYLQYYKYQWLRVQQGSTFEAINKTDLTDMIIKTPPLIEQHKIAEIITSVDNAISKTEAIIEQTEKVKKGLMQQLLTKGIGHTKFKQTEIGDIPEEWELKTLEDVSNGKAEYGIGARATSYIEGQPRYLRITDIDERGKLSHSDIKGLDKDGYEKYLLEPGDIVFARTGNTTGKSYLYSKEDGELVFAGFLIRFRLNKNIVSPQYISYVVQTKYYWNWVKAMSTRSGQPGINGNEYSAFKIPVPPLSEQERIASLLVRFDNKIENEIKKIKTLMLIKQGLMQVLLTGKVRVNVDEQEVS